MSLVVNSNTTAMNALGHLNRTQRGLSSSFAKISSGLRITNASDDAAGLAVAENLDAQSLSAGQAKRNINDGLSVIGIYEGAADEISDILKRIRELAIQASSETLSDTERAYIDTDSGGGDDSGEVPALLDELQRIADTTEFNGIHLLNAGDSNGVFQMNVQVGLHDSSDDRITIDMLDLQEETLSDMVDDLGLEEPFLATAASAQAAITSLDAMLDHVNGARSKVGAVQNRLESALNNMETYDQNLQASESRIRDADFAYETAEMAKYQVMQQAGVAILGQANGLAQGALRLI